MGIDPVSLNPALNQWSYVEDDLSSLAGKQIEYVLVGYDDNSVSETGQYRAYIDKLEIIPLE